MQLIETEISYKDTDFKLQTNGLQRFMHLYTTKRLKEASRLVKVCNMMHGYKTKHNHCLIYRHNLLFTN